ncbi:MULTISPECIES: hypothetical protein [Bacillus]|uniref:hypothetical protein n=1 Tax=Bacillus TaxID=1386 RepID=UPI000625F00B|nr:hypothetical protein [Bacillus sp. L_1B0_12]KKK10357.1 hypothetical protein UF15_07640 [Bacillus sp. L_1B0_12]
MLSKDQINVDLFDEVTRLKREIEKKNQQLNMFAGLFLNGLYWEQRNYEVIKDEYHRGGLVAMRNIEKKYEQAFGKGLDGEKV